MDFTRQLQRLIHLPRRIVRELSMVIQVVTCFLINRFSRSSVTEPNGPVVSLTTWGQRCKTAYLTIESIARGYTLPSRLILWIDELDTFHNLPATIRRLQGRGLEVKLCKNYGPHKKYYPYVESKEEFDTPLVTADDDVLYPKNWLDMLVKANNKNPEDINCYIAHVIEMDDIGIVKFKNMKYCDSVNSSFCHLAIGAAGIIYPPSFLMVLKRAGSDFETCCPKGDDLWLHVQALRAGFKVRQILPRLPYLYFHNSPGTQLTALCHDNIDCGDGYERQGRDTYNEADIRLLRED